VAERLRNDPDLTPESVQHSHFLDFIRSLRRHPKHALVFVIDVLDECGNTQSRPRILRVLTDAAIHAPWLKIIITSRPEVDIQRFFDAPVLSSSHVQYDLAADQEANTDLQNFAQTQFNLVASKWYLPSPWPEKPLFTGIIARANGLFIFIKTLILALEHCADPTESLKATLQDSVGIGLTSLNELYSSILRAQIVHDNAEFRRMIGVLLTTAQYRPLCEGTIAELAGVQTNLVKKWVDGLSSLLYRDEAANREIRVRHLSVSSSLSVLPATATIESASTMRTRSWALLASSFNICHLDDSRLPNAAVQDLPFF
jgi:hypothetical protein